MAELAHNFDTRPSVARLVATGVPEEQAEAVIEECVSHIATQIEASYANLATQDSLTMALDRITQLQIESNEKIAQLQKEIAQLQKEIERSRNETNERIAALQKETSDKFAETNERIAETNERIAQVQLETARLLTQQHKETLNTLKWGAGFVIASIVAMAAIS